jgi:hypothetical protein
MNFTGILIKESLTAKMPSGVKVLREDTVPSDEPNKTWGQLICHANLSQIKELAGMLDGEGWHAVFARDNAAIVIFQNKVLRISKNDKNTWAPVYNYGRSVGLKDNEMDLYGEFAKLDQYALFSETQNLKSGLKQQLYR